MAANGINTNELKAVMAYQGITQKALAAKTGMATAQLNQIILGKASANISTAQKIGNALKLTNEQFAEIFYNKAGDE